MPEEEAQLKSKFKLKKTIQMLEAIKGRHTELVTVYVPTGYNILEVINQLRNEESTAENIKSKPVRKNVVTALEKIMRYLQFYKKTPASGLAVFCGNISEKEGQTDIHLWAIEPPEPIKVKMYWCDQRFVVDPLKEQIEEKEIYGIICLDKSEADIAILNGKRIEPIAHFESIVPGKSRAGGQSSARFSRVREGLLNDWLKRIGEAANKIFGEHKEVLGILLSGSGPIKDMFYKEDYLHTTVKDKIIGTVDTSYTGDHGLEETLVRGEDLIKELAVTKEKKLLQKFFTDLQRPGGLAVYGLENTMKAMEMGAMNTLIITETAPIREVEYSCNCGTKKSIVKNEKKHNRMCKKCKKHMSIISEDDAIEALEEKANKYGTKLVVVSSETREGQQFTHIGGIGGLLRYDIGHRND